MLKALSGTTLILALASSPAIAQDASSAVANASKALGADGLNSITYSGTASTGNFGQSQTIAGPLAVTAITSYTRAIDLAQPASRATGPTMPPAIPGAPPPQPGTFNQNITPANTAWTQQLEIWVTPWGFLRGAAASNATARVEGPSNAPITTVTWSPPQKAPSGQPYHVVGHITGQNLIDRVQTWVEHPVLGDLLVETIYSDYRDFGGVKVPTRIVQKRDGMTAFEATITSATANPPNIAELLRPPSGGAPPPATPPGPQSEKLADGVYRITGGYVALAVEFKDHVVVLEGGQSEARGLAVIAEARKVIPNKPITYVVNTHAHFDHASGLAPFVAEDITIITHRNNRAYLMKALMAPRTLVGDAFAKSGKRPKIEEAGEKKLLKDSTRTIELHHVRGLAHSDGMLIAYLPKEKILFTGDFNVPAAGQPVSPSIGTLVENVNRLKLDFDRHVLVHPPTPDRPLTRADLMELAKGTK